MHFSPLTVEELEPLDKIVKQMIGMSTKRIIVMAGDSIRGIITVHDLSLALFRHTAKSDIVGHKSNLCAEDIMTPDPKTAAPKDDVAEAAKTMLDMNIGGIPVASPNLEGLLDRNDLLKGFEVAL